MRNFAKPAAFILVGIATAGLILLRGDGLPSATAQPLPAESSVEEPHPPEGQTYIGSKRCSACHFKEFTAWKKSKHAKEAWESVPAKYRTNAECLACHTTGFGRETGFKDLAATPNLVGASCESCHGAGSEHETICKTLTDKKQLTPEEEKQARDSIYRMQPHNVCATCHASRGHKEHPKYTK